MESLEKRIKKLADIWNYYFWDYKFCQDKINFTDDIKTNYYGDILSFIETTLNSLTAVEYEKGVEKSIFQAVGILQIIYTHQDLIDELLYIFKIHQSTSVDKNPNRQIRNELIGHPIRRVPKSKELISSVFFGYEFKNGTLDYVLYSKENNFSPKAFSYQLEDLIRNHKVFLEKYMNIIWAKIEKILRALQRELIELNNLVLKNIEFTKIVNLVHQRYNKIFKENYLFEPEIILQCYEKRNENIRYQNAISLFTDTLKEYLPDTINNIDQLFIEQPEPKFEELNIKINIVKHSSKKIARDKSQHLDYEFSKLHHNHPIFGIEYFMNKFKNDKDIITELLHMEKYIDNVLEFNSAFEYLRILLIEKKYLNP
jgi:hypothetical protein